MRQADAAWTLTGAADDYDPLLERTRDARFVLLGEASHGTDEFYRERAEITKRLVADQGLTAVAAEADWPDAYRVNLFVRGRAARRARDRYACFDHFGRDPNTYAYATGSGRAEPCEPEVVEQLLELRRLAAEAASGDGAIPDDRRFYAEQNARLVVNAERYYRAVFRGGAESWNLRDRHMAETLDELTSHLERTQGPAKTAVWAHNSHVGDARATEVGERGELNVGQLVRERHGRASLTVGFTTYTGTVTAASDWGLPAERKHVRPARPGSIPGRSDARGSGNGGVGVMA